MSYTGSKAVAYVVGNRSAVIRRLIDVGVIPAECTRFELVCAVNEPIRATCTFNVNEEQLEQIAKAYEEYPEEAAAIIREIVRPEIKAK